MIKLHPICQSPFWSFIPFLTRPGTASNNRAFQNFHKINKKAEEIQSITLKSPCLQLMVLIINQLVALVIPAIQLPNLLADLLCRML